MTSSQSTLEEQPIEDSTAHTNHRTPLQVLLMVFAVGEFVIRVASSFTFVHSYQIQIACLSTIFPILLLLAVVYEKKNLFVIYLIYNGFYIACYWLQTGFFVYLAAELPADYVKWLILKEDFLDDQWDVQVYFILLSVMSALSALGLHFVRQAIRSVVASIDTKEDQHNKVMDIDNALPPKYDNILFVA